MSTPPAVVAIKPMKIAAQAPSPCSRDLRAPRIANHGSENDLKKASVRRRKCSSLDSAKR